MNRKLKKIFLVLFASLLISVPVIPALAVDTTDTGTDQVNATIPVACSFDATTLQIEHPVTIDYTIGNNSIIAPDITIKTNNYPAIKVKLLQFKSTAGGDIQFTDVASDAKVWANLNNADSKAFIALGIGAYGTGWQGSTVEGYVAPHMYAVNSDTIQSGGGMDLGTIPGATSYWGASAVLRIDGYCGSAFDKAYTAKHALILEFELA